jgi:hypothetical protein
MRIAPRHLWLSITDFVPQHLGMKALTGALIFQYGTFGIFLFYASF